MNLDLIKEITASQVTLVAVSKTKPAASILELYNTGHKDFGENRVQEMVDKQAELSEDIQWHMIGHLQKNKVKYIAPFVHLIHSVDSLELAKIISKEAKKNDRIIDVLIQIKIATEDSKSGISMSALENDIDALLNLDNIRICGVMGIGTLTENNDITKSEFEKLRHYFKKLKSKYFDDRSYFKEISMGMSSDYKLAIQSGATMVRIGSLIFGKRD